MTLLLSDPRVAAVPVRDVTRWYLHMNAPGELAPAPAPLPGFAVRRAEVPSADLGRFLYAAVGGPWYWIDRLAWDWGRWQAHLERPQVELWVGWMRGTPAGYGELVGQGDQVMIAYFGLLPEFIGQGIGPRLLHAVTRQAWALGPRRVHLSTCTLDGPAARRTYRRAGFAEFDERLERVSLPDAPPEPWPGARRPLPRG
jgi:GNAT superfamily N-acetyltransferase